MANPIVHIVDDEQALRQALTRILVLEGFAVKTYESAELFLESSQIGPGDCLITDVRLPGMSGMDLLSQVRSRAPDLKVIILTAHADVPLAVLATKIGAVDVLEKPFEIATLMTAIRSAGSATARAPGAMQKSGDASARFADLSAREHEVLERLILGLQNKLIAYELGISHRTVEIHRANIMKKTGVSSLSELVRLYLNSEA